jgi:plastocyanin
MKRRMLLLFLMLFFAFAVTSCSNSSNGTPYGTQTASPTAAPTATPNDGTGNEAPAVTIESFSFKPQVLTIKAGTTVVWTNKDTAAHNIKSSEFSSPSLKTGETYEFKFEKAGTYEYICGIHPKMTGKIIVK